MSTDTSVALHEHPLRNDLRPVTLRDLDTLQRRCWPHVRRQVLHRLVARAVRMAEQGFGVGVVAVDGEGAYAYGQITCWPRCGEISDLIVSEALRDHGTGTGLIHYLIETARSLSVTCIEIGAAADNPRAAALYRRLGFRDAYTVRVALERGEVDVIYLRLDLPTESTPEVGQGASEMLR
jgi:ribosomal protein S18 acetylase RimI-like enzyme